MLAVRRYLYAYIVGFLYLLAFAIVWGTPPRLVALATFIAAVDRAAGNATVPPGVAVFALIVAGVVVPYCISVVIQPLTTALANVVFKRRVKRVDPNDTETVFQAADTVVRTTVGEDFQHNDGTMLLYLKAVAPRLAIPLERSLDDFYFRVEAILPTAVFLAAVAYRLISTRWVGIVVASAVALVTMIGSTAEIYGSVVQFRRRVSVAILLAQKKLVESNRGDDDAA